MKRLQQIIALIFILLVVTNYSCNTDNNTETTEEPTPVPEFISEKILIDLSYPPFEDTIIKVILTGIGLCSDEVTNGELPPCSHELFRIFQNGLDKPWQAGFLVEIKPGVFSETFRVLNVSYIDKKYKVTNDYAGELLEMHSTETGNYDILVRHPLTEGTVAILHKWKNDKYEPVTVTEINDHFVKPEKVDSLNAIYIDNFAWDL